MKKTLLFMLATLLPAPAIEQKIASAVNNVAGTVSSDSVDSADIIDSMDITLRIIEEETWPNKGDMYGWRANPRTPLKIIICEDELYPVRLFECYDSFKVVRDDSIFEARKFKEGGEWFPTYKVDKSYLKRLSNDYLKGWLEQTNHWLGYLSGNHFQLKLEGIERVKTDYWNERFNFQELPLGSAFTMIVHPQGGPLAGGGGYYLGEGAFTVDPLDIHYAEGTLSKCSITPIHEILHGFFGPGHSADTLSTICNCCSYIGLAKDEAELLGWSKVKPKRLERVEF